MKLEDTELIIDEINQIREVIKNTNYNTITEVNSHLLKIEPIMKGEKRRLEDSKLKVNGPQLLLLKAETTLEKEADLVKTLNQKLQELILNDFKIIDYGLFYKDDKEICMFIKYSS